MIAQSIKMAFHSIRSNKMRSFLTMLGIIIGVVALVVLVSLVSGATGEITDTINEMGNNMISVSVMDDKNKPFKLSDMDEIEGLEHVELVSPVAQESLTASSSTGEETATVTGTTSSYDDIMGLSLASGRFIMKPDVDNNSNVAVINSSLAEDVMGRTDVVGESIIIGGRSFQIIGVLEEDDSSWSSMLGTSYEAYIPYTTLIRISDSTTLKVSSFYASAEDDNTSEAEVDLTEFLNERFENDSDAYYLFNQSTVADAMSSVTGTLSLLLGGIAGISLLVGGIGIMNIMLVSVTERTREIGIRKAIGATRGTIMFQFLIEALILSLTGCAIGIGISWILIIVIDAIGNVTYGLSGQVVLISVMFSVGIGLLFGIYPAGKAAGKNPIDALRAQ